MSKTTTLIIITGLLIGFSSCKEQPVILSTSVVGADSTYVAAPETPQAKKVLATELTGVRCPNCPEGAEELETLSQQNGNSIVTVSLHSGILTKPIDHNGLKSKYDFRTDDGDAILNQIFGGDPNSKPSVCYNRLPLSSKANPYFLDNYSQNWGPGLTQALGQENPVLINLSVSSEYNSSTKKYDIRVKVAYNQTVSDKQKLNLYLTEDSIIDVQQTTDPFNEFDSNYVFMHVFRHAITGISGHPVLDSLATKEAGRVYVFHTSIALEPPVDQNWNPKHMHIAAFVSKGSGPDIHVYQSALTSLE